MNLGGGVLFPTHETLMHVIASDAKQSVLVCITGELLQGPNSGEIASADFVGLAMTREGCFQRMDRLQSALVIETGGTGGERFRW